jgi:sec-independent protein translocase protein TatA
MMSLPILAPLGLGPLELGLILLIVVLVFGVGRLPEVGGAVGKGIREFRKATKDDETEADAAATMQSTAAPADAPATADEIFCSECGTKNARVAKFCANCGHAIGTAVS